MIISNLRLESKGSEAFLIADVECGFSTSNQFWFSVKRPYDSWLTPDVYDAFLVSAIWPCMCYNEDITIKGNVTKSIYKNILYYIIPFLKDIRPQFHLIKIDVEGFKDSETNDLGIIGTGFSGGIDSFSTIYDRFYIEKDKQYKINTLFFFNIGQYGNIKSESSLNNALKHFNLSKIFADEVGLPYVFMNSNMFDFYKPEWEYDAGPLCRAASILVFQKVISIFYVASSYSYTQLCDFQSFYHLDEVSEPFLYSLLSTTHCRMMLDGGQEKRTEKTIKLLDYEPTQRHLNVCVNENLDLSKEKNCSVCHKCNRTLSILEAIGALDKYSKVFDIDKYKKQSQEFKSRARLQYSENPFYKDILDFLNAQGIKTPSKLSAWLYLFPIRVNARVKKYFKK